MAKVILIALGGNAIKQADEKGTSEEQFRNCWKTTKHISEIIKNLDKEDRLIITHGNGPQVGNLMVQQKLAEDVVPAHPMADGCSRGNDSRANWLYVTTNIKESS